ncbi:MAG: NifU family protein [Chlorobiota bacterium]|nr:NifU family protein [Chlorobiota bacterium]QQS66090.1 MAG: NifU family protein [Chlorobiota bacterium]
MNIEDKILSAIQIIRPYLQQDGGDIEFVNFEESTRTCEIRFIGNCENCALAILTLRAGVEKTLIYYVPEIRRVERVK